VAYIARCQKVEELPLKIFAKDSITNSPFTWYIKKGNWYYKARHKSAGVNISAKKMNAQFELMLASFEYNKEYISILKKNLMRKLEERLESHLVDSASRSSIFWMKAYRQSRILSIRIKVRISSEIYRPIIKVICDDFVTLACIGRL